MPKTYDEIVKALEKELGCDVLFLCMTSSLYSCDVCGDQGTPRFRYFERQGAEPMLLCADRPACRARAKRQQEERERAVCEAVVLEE